MLCPNAGPVSTCSWTTFPCISVGVWSFHWALVSPLLLPGCTTILHNAMRPWLVPAAKISEKEATLYKSSEAFWGLKQICTPIVWFWQSRFEIKQLETKQILKKAPYTVHTIRQMFCSYLFQHSVKHSWSSLLSQTPESRRAVIHSCHLAPGPTAWKIKSNRYSDTHSYKLGIYSITGSVDWPDDMFPCCCDEEAVACPDNIYVLPGLAAQLDLSWKNVVTN